MSDTPNKRLSKAYKATPATIKLILNSIANGLTQRDSAILAGISEDTLSLWKRDNSDFSEQIRQKEIEFKQKNINIIQKASEKSWQAAAWLLERKYRDEFSTKPDKFAVSEEFRRAMDFIHEDMMRRKPRPTQVQTQS